MRLRHTLAATAGALLITVSVPNSATAATGDFEYRGPLLGSHTLNDPPNQQCLNIGQATDLLPAQSPKNFTTSTATVFLDFDCDGDTLTVLQPGQTAGLLVKFRSVLFN
ncbi:hypothetical protein AB0F20_29685 [Streptomyces goshikiensis]|uniref:hypothetical protein n=1 Tax=Streptomyces goshikiensis TaxID=1942 RepID=UPI003402ED4B